MPATHPPSHPTTQPTTLQPTQPTPSRAQPQPPNHPHPQNHASIHPPTQPTNQPTNQPRNTLAKPTNRPSAATHVHPSVATGRWQRHRQHLALGNPDEPAIRITRLSGDWQLQVPLRPPEAFCSYEKLICPFGLVLGLSLFEGTVLERL